MTYQEVLEKAREVMAPKCKVCPECNGIACKGKTPGGVGAVGSGTSFTNARDFLNSIQVLMDVVYDPKEIDTSIELWGHKFDMPFFMAPIGGMAMNYSGYFTDDEFTKIIVKGMAECGNIAFTPDGPQDGFFELALPYIKEVGGRGIPTVKPWQLPVLLEKIEKAKEAGAWAIACDLDSCGNLNLKKAGKPVYPMAPETMAEVVKKTEIPFMPKGIMTPASAKRCAEAGCYGIVVSNHGGRVIDYSPAPASMVPAIREAVGDSLKIIVDGGVRSGIDVFKCLALGADAVLIGRPYTIAAHGGREEGLKLYTEKILAGLKDIMLMTGCNSLADITMDKIVMPK